MTIDIHLPFFVKVEAMAYVTFGLTALSTRDGIGLVTRGFLWPNDTIYEPCDRGISTTWTACE